MVLPVDINVIELSTADLVDPQQINLSYKLKVMCRGIAGNHWDCFVSTDFGWLEISDASSKSIDFDDIPTEHICMAMYELSGNS